MSSDLTYNNDKSIVFDQSTKTFYLLRDISFNLDQMDDFTSITTNDGHTRQHFSGTKRRYSHSGGGGWWSRTFYYNEKNITNQIRFVLRSGYTFNGLGNKITFYAPVLNRLIKTDTSSSGGWWGSRTYITSYYDVGAELLSIFRCLSTSFSTPQIKILNLEIVNQDNLPFCSDEYYNHNGIFGGGSNTTIIENCKVVSDVKNEGETYWRQNGLYFGYYTDASLIGCVAIGNTAAGCSSFMGSWSSGGLIECFRSGDYNRNDMLGSYRDSGNMVGMHNPSRDKRMLIKSSYSEGYGSNSSTYNSRYKIGFAAGAYYGREGIGMIIDCYSNNAEYATGIGSGKERWWNQQYEVYLYGNIYPNKINRSAYSWDNEGINPQIYLPVGTPGLTGGNTSGGGIDLLYNNNISNLNASSYEGRAGSYPILKRFRHFPWDSTTYNNYNDEPNFLNFGVDISASSIIFNQGSMDISWNFNKPDVVANPKYKTRTYTYNIPSYSTMKSNALTATAAHPRPSWTGSIWAYWSALDSWKNTTRNLGWAALRQSYTSPYIDNEYFSDNSTVPDVKYIVDIDGKARITTNKSISVTLTDYSKPVKIYTIYNDILSNHVSTFKIVPIEVEITSINLPTLTNDLAGITIDVSCNASGATDGSVIGSLTVSWASGAFFTHSNIEQGNGGNNLGIQLPRFSNKSRSTLVDMLSQNQKLNASVMASDDQFGWSVAISGNYAIIGAPESGIFGPGAAYIFESDSSGNWNQTQKLTASDGASNDYFGYSVAIDGDYAIIGAYGDDTNKGSAYIFKRDSSGNWGNGSGTTRTETEKITTTETGAYFGHSVAIDGVHAIIGAYGENTNTGAVYFFKRDTSGNWGPSFFNKVTASDGATYDKFGSSVAINGSNAIVGASDDDSRKGSVYFFKINPSTGNWYQTQKFTSSTTRVNNDYFGHSVAISGNYAIVGAFGKNSNNGESDVYQLSGGTWSHNQNITASDGGLNIFGKSVAIDGDYIVIGGSRNDSYKGAAYIFKSDSSGNWFETQKITASDRQNNDYFGASVAISGNNYIVGAYGDDDGPAGPMASSGSVYIFEKGLTTVTYSGTTPGIADGYYDNLYVQINGTSGLDGVAFLTGFNLDTTGAFIDITPPWGNIIKPTLNTNTFTFDLSFNEVCDISTNIGYGDISMNDVSNNISITISGLPDGDYTSTGSNPTFTSVDRAGNIKLHQFTSGWYVDTTPPVISLLRQPVDTHPIAGKVPRTSDSSGISIDIISNESGTFSCSLSVVTTDTSVTVSNLKTIVFSNLADGLYSGETVTVTDAAGNTSDELVIPDFIVDTVRPMISIITPIDPSGNDTTPRLFISVNESVDISCSSPLSITSALYFDKGNYYVDFNQLADGLYSGHTITAKDIATDTSGNYIDGSGNTNRNIQTITIPDFEINTVPPNIEIIQNIPDISTNRIPMIILRSDKICSVDCKSLFFFDLSAVPIDNKNFPIGVKNFYLAKNVYHPNWDGLDDGLYKNMSLRFIDEYNNLSYLIIPDFIVDNTAPIITLNGPELITVEKNNIYVDTGLTSTLDYIPIRTSYSSGVTAITGTKIEDVSNSLIIENNYVDNVGEHKIKYSVKDLAGNIATKNRTITVIPYPTRNVMISNFCKKTGNRYGNVFCLYWERFIEENSSYEIWKKKEGGGFLLLTTIEGDSFIDEDSQEGQKYHFKLRTKTKVNNKIYYSNYTEIITIIAGRRCDKFTFGRFNTSSTNLNLYPQNLRLIDPVNKPLRPLLKDFQEFPVNFCGERETKTQKARHNNIFRNTTNKISNKKLTSYLLKYGRALR